MSLNFTRGHIVRTFPALIDGSFNVGIVVDFENDKLVVVDYAVSTVTTDLLEEEVWSRFKVEMYMFHGKNGLYAINDAVSVYGYEGTFTVEKFGQNPRSTEGEWCAALVHEDGKRRLFTPAHQLMKV